MSIVILSAEQVRRALSIRDLSDPKQGPHAMQLLIEQVLHALECSWSCRVEIHRVSPIVSIADNYDRLRYPSDGPARAARYTRYVCETALLRTHTSAMIPGLLRGLAKQAPRDVLVACPGLVYRRDSIDRLHTGEPHQMDLWRIRDGAPLSVADLQEMIHHVVAAVLPRRKVRTVPAEHPYTTQGLQIEVEHASEWVEIGECGIALGQVLSDSGLDTAKTSGLAMGLGLDRILMLRKGIDDIRLLRAQDARILQQMLDLTVYRPVSSMPAVQRDLSIVREYLTSAEEIGDIVRGALHERADVIESVQILSDTPYDALPVQAIARLGIAPNQRNILLRIVLRAVDRSLTHEECNELRDLAYAALHQGTVWQWARGR